MSTLKGTGVTQPSTGDTTGGGDDTTGDDAGGGDDDGGGGDDGGGPPPSQCVYTDDKSYCECMKWNCGGASIVDSKNQNAVVYCGACQSDQYCVPAEGYGVGVGTCGGANPVTLQYQKQKIDMLVSLGENDNTKINYSFCSDIGDGRGYTIGKVGFCTGTGDFVIVAACYNDLKPNNVLSKYWKELVRLNDLFNSSGANQKDTTGLDKIGNFKADIATAAGEADGIFNACQDSMADAFDLAPAAVHIDEKKLQGAITAGFLYDMELNFGDDDDPGTGPADATAGTKTIIARADKDYGPNLPTDFTGKPWEESKWLGYLIFERAKAMAANSTWKSALDQNATWEAARRLNTAKSNGTESDTKLDMDYDFVSKYKAGASVGGNAPCWTIAGALDTEASIYTITTDKSSGSDPTKWVAKGTLDSKGTFAACPANPTP